MNELSKIRKNGVDYDIKDATARAAIEELKQNGAGGSTPGGSTSMVTKVASGEVVTITPAAGTTARVVSKITEQEIDWYYNHNLKLRHFKGKNLYDFAERFGGVGTVVEKDGITATINENGTVTVKGTNTTSGYVNILRVTATDANAKDWRWPFPAGTYTVDTGLTVRPVSIILGSESSPGNKTGTFTMSEPWFMHTAYITVEPGATVDKTIPLMMVSGTSLPSTGFSFEGEVYNTVEFVHEIAGCAFNWQTGELKDADGNVIETIAPFTDFPVLEGDNTFMTGVGETTVTYTAESNSSSDSGTVGAFDPEVWGLPVLYLNGSVSAMNKDNAVTLSYIYGLREGTCTVKWQGSSSLAYMKKNYTIKFDNAFEAKAGWGEQKKYCLKANYIDHSHSRNIVNAKLWGQIVKNRSSAPANLKNLINGGAIDGFPIMLVMNGECLGLYTWNIPKDGWMFGMGESAVETIVCASGNTSGRVVEGFKQPVTVWDTGFDLEYIGDESDENKAAMMQSLNNLINACINSNGSDLDTIIAQYLDWDSAIDYWIFTILVMGHDMVTKNYLLYTYDGIKWRFGAYDLDCTHGLESDGTSWKKANYYPYPSSMASQHRLFELISLYKKNEFKSRYAVIKEQIMSEDDLYFEFTNFAGQIPKPVYMQDAKLWPMIPNTSTNDIAQIRDYYRMRIAQVDKWIEAM